MIKRRFSHRLVVVIIGLSLAPTVGAALLHRFYQLDLISGRQLLAGVPFSFSLADLSLWSQIFNWGATYAAFFTFAISYAYFKLERNLAVLAIGTGLLLSGFAIGSLKIIEALLLSDPVAENGLRTVFRLLAHTASPLILGSFLFVVLAFRTLKWPLCLLTLAWITLLAAAPHLLSLYSETLSKTALAHPQLSLTQSYALVPLFLVLVLAVVFIRPFDARLKSYFSHSLLISVFPNIISQLHLIFASASPNNAHVLLAESLQLLVFSIPFVGLTLDYSRTFKEKNSSLQRAQQEKQLVESKNDFLQNEISERVAIENALRTSEKQYRELVETSNDLIWSVDTNGRWTFLNRAACLRTLGYEAETLIGRPFTELQTPEVATRDSKTFLQILAGQAVFQYETEFVHRNGSAVQLSFNAIVSRDEQGNAVGTTGTASDVSQRRLAERALAEQSRFFRKVIDTNPNLIFAKDTEGRFTLVNQAVADVYGTSAETLLGKTDADFNDNQLEVEHFRNDDQGVLSTGKELFIPEEYITDAEGRSRVLQTVKRPILNNRGEITHVMGVATDITERKRIEEAFRKNEERTRAILDTAVDAIITVSRTGRIQSLNPAAERLFGFTLNELLGRNICQLVASPYAFELQHLFDSSLVKQPHAQPGVGREMKGKKRDGAIFPIEVSVSGLNSTLEVYTAIIRDITERKRAEDSLKDSERQLRRQNNVLLELAKNKSLGSGNLSEALREITEAASRTLDVDRVGVWALNEQQTELTCLDQYERLSDQHFIEASLPSKNFSNYFRSIREERALTVNDALADPRTTELAQEYLIPRGISSLIDAPIRIGSKVVAIICHEHSGSKRNWTLEEQNFVGSMADLVALSFEAQERRKVQDSLQSKAAFEKLITRISTNFINLPAEGIDGGIVEALRQIAEFNEADRGYLFLIDESGRVISNTHEWCRAQIEPHQERLQNLPLERFRWIKHKLENLDIIHLPRLGDLPNSAAAERLEFDLDGIRSLICVPLLYAGEAVGFLGFDSVREEKRWPDEIISLLHIVADIFVNALERKKVDEQVREHATLLDIAQDAVVVTDRDDKILFWNTSAQLIYGWPSSEVIGRRLSEVVCAIPSYAAERIQTTLKESGKWRGEMSHKNREGREVVVESRLSLIADRDKQAKSVLVLSSDITEKKKWEAELVKATRLESIGILAGGIAHDFNNILTAIVGNLCLMKLELAADGSVYQRVERIEKATQRAKDLTQQLLTFAKGGAPIKRAASVVELIRETAEFTLRGTSCRGEFFLPDDLWAIEVDENQITQVFNNLLINSTQAMPDGGIITFRCQNILLSSPSNNHNSRLTPGKFVKISISDQGMGIASANLDKIFDPFFTTKESGTGLGLSTTYSIVKQHQGHINVDSQQGHGTTFHLYLPASDAKIMQKTVEPQSLPKGSGKILVMDDEDIVLEITASMLRALGYEVECATDGAMAIEMYELSLAEGSRYDLLVMDLTVPGGMGGATAIRKLLELDPNLKAIVSSGYSGDRSMTNAEAVGFKALITKPYLMSELAKIVSEVLSTTAAGAEEELAPAAKAELTISS